MTEDYYRECYSMGGRTQPLAIIYFAARLDELIDEKEKKANKNG
jgi:hypothetical protein